MNVLIGGSCCALPCVNSSIFTWSPFTLGAGGSFSRQQGFLHIAAGSSLSDEIALIDTQRNVNTRRNFCFTTTIQREAGPAVVAGLTTRDLTTAFIDVELTSSSVILLWKNSVGETSHVLNVSADTSKHTFRVCRVANKVTVLSDGNLQTFDVDANFPQTFLQATGAAVDGGILNLYDFCARYRK